MNKIELALDLINFALNQNSVDYIYVLEDLEKILLGTKNTFNKDDYWD